MTTRWRVQMFWLDSEGVEHPHGHEQFDSYAQAWHWLRSSAGFTPSPYLRADIQRCDGPPGTRWTTVDRGEYLTEKD